MYYLPLLIYRVHNLLTAYPQTAFLQRKRNPRPTYGSDADSSIDNALTFSDKGSTISTHSSQHGYPESYDSQASEKSQNRQDTYNEMGRIINLVNGHNRPHVDHKIVQHLEASLVSQWRCVLHDTDDEDVEQTTEDRRLTAALGMAIGHTRRLCARLPNEANETLHGYKPSHATGLEIANIEAWLHEEGLQIPVDPYNETVQIRIC